MRLTVRAVVELVHAVLGHRVHAAAPHGQEQCGCENDKECGARQCVEALARDKERRVLDEHGTRLEAAEVRVFDDLARRVEPQRVAGFCAHLVAKGGVVLHIMVKLVELALLQEPLFIFHLNAHARHRGLQHVHARYREEQNPDAENEVKHMGEGARHCMPHLIRIYRHALQPPLALLPGLHADIDEDCY